MVIRHYEMMLGKEMTDLYYEYLDNDDSPDKLRIQVQQPKHSRWPVKYLMWWFLILRWLTYMYHINLSKLYCRYWEIFKTTYWKKKSGCTKQMQTVRIVYEISVHWESSFICIQFLKSNMVSQSHTAYFISREKACKRGRSEGDGGYTIRVRAFPTLHYV